ncbi:MAG: hypothetical protein WB471_10050 [Nocardioides sp.]
MVLVLTVAGCSGGPGADAEPFRSTMSDLPVIDSAVAPDSPATTGVARPRRLVALPDGLLTEDDLAYADPGEQVRFARGGYGSIEGNELVVSAAGVTSWVDLGTICFDNWAPTYERC